MSREPSHLPHEHGEDGGLDINMVSYIDYLCSVAQLHKVFYLWRPVLADPDDDMVLELAVEAGCDRIVTHNTKDFAGVERFGLSAVTPQHFLHEIGVIS